MKGFYSENYDLSGKQVVVKVVCVALLFVPSGHSILVVCLFASWVLSYFSFFLFLVGAINSPVLDTPPREVWR